MAERNNLLFAPDEARALRQIQGEIENVRAAWNHVLDRGQTDLLEVFLQSF